MGNDEYGPPPSGYPASGDPAVGNPASAPQPEPTVTEFAPPPFEAAHYPEAQYPAPMMPTATMAWQSNSTERNWMGVTSLVLGCVGGGLLGIVFGVLGISAAKQGRATNKTMATWGVVLNIAVPILLVVVLLGTGVLAGAFDNNRVEYDDLAVGDCIQEPPGWNDQGSDLDDLKVAKVACADAHWGQLYFRAPLAGSEYPGDDDEVAQVEDLCFSDEAAASISPAHLDDAFAYYIMPTKEAWRQGDRDAFCFVSDENHTALGSWVVGS